MNENDTINQCMSFAKACHLSDHSGHDFEHILRVYQNACKLLEEETTANAFIVKAAALLHDVDDRKLNEGEKRLPAFLDSLNLPEQTKQAILKVTSTIDFSSTGSHPDFDTIEQAVVFDADKLDAIGAIGICRTILYGASKGRPLFDKNIFPNPNLTKEEYKDPNRKENTAINHFFDKLLKLPKIMQTPAGKKQASVRYQTMIDFLRAFFQEQNLSEWQNYLEEYLKNNL